MRWWLGGGRGGFGVSPRECPRSSFYCLVTTLEEGAPLRNPGSDYLRGRKVKTSPVPIKDPFFATLKSNNYLANVLTVIDAERDGFDYVSPPATAAASLRFFSACWCHHMMPCSPDSF